MWRGFRSFCAVLRYRVHHTKTAYTEHLLTMLKHAAELSKDRLLEQVQERFGNGRTQGGAARNRDPPLQSAGEQGDPADSAALLRLVHDTSRDVKENGLLKDRVDAIQRIFDRQA